MNHLRRTFAGSVLLLASLLSLSAGAQNRQEPIGAELERQRSQAPEMLDPALIQIERRQALPFVPFEMVDVASGEPIPPDRILELPDGKRMRADEYFQQLNEIERGLAEMGYSLREDWDSITIQRSVVDEAALRASARRMRSQVDASKPFRLRSQQELEDALKPQPAVGDLRQPLATLRLPKPGPAAPQVIERRPALVPPVDPGLLITPKPKPKPALVTSAHDYPFEIGDPKLFAASVNGRLETSGSEELMKLVGKASARISVFGIGSDIARLDALVNAPKTGDMSGRVTLDVLPFGTVYDLKLTGASVKKSDEATRGLDVEFANFRVMIGPVPVKVAAGAQGSVGMRYFAGLNPSAAVGEFAPIVRSNLYVSAAADYYVAGVGVSTALTLVDYDLSMYGELRLWMQVPEGGSKPEMGIREVYQISQKLKLLGGNAYAFAYVYYPKCCIPPWGKKEWRWEIFNWDGFTPLNGELVDVTRWTSLGIKP